MSDTLTIDTTILNRIAAGDVAVGTEFALNPDGEDAMVAGFGDNDRLLYVKYMETYLPGSFKIVDGKFIRTRIIIIKRLGDNTLFGAKFEAPQGVTVDEPFTSTVSYMNEIAYTEEVVVTKHYAFVE